MREHEYMNMPLNYRERRAIDTPPREWTWNDDKIEIIALERWDQISSFPQTFLWCITVLKADKFYIKQRNPKLGHLWSPITES